VTIIVKLIAVFGHVFYISDAKKEQEKEVGGVAEIANAYWNKYDKVSNPIPEKVLT